MDERLAVLRLFVRVWMRYYGLSAVYRDWPQLDTWLRRRLRMGYWVMWNRPLRLRFSPKVAAYIRHRVWHGTHRMEERADGSLDLALKTSG